MTTTKERRPDFRCSASDLSIIDRIVDRAMKMAGAHRDGRLAMYMDIAACNNSCPLKLPELLAADDNNFAHDVFGINRHMNRDTGELGDCFIPRFSK